MISGRSAGSSSSSTDRIGFTFLASTSGAESSSSTTKPVVSFVPSGTSTRDPRRTESRSAGGMA
jgi:hypothetical protein